MAIKALPHPEEPPRARLEKRKPVMQPFVQFLPSLSARTERSLEFERVSPLPHCGRGGTQLAKAGWVRVTPGQLTACAAAPNFAFVAGLAAGAKPQRPSGSVWPER